MKFIHAADLHLDSPFLGLQNHIIPSKLWSLIRESTFTSFKKMVDDAIQQNVDFVLLVGDLFDRNDHSVRVETRFFEELNRLADHQIPVLISFGNHDYFNGDPSQLGYPANTTVFPNKVTTTNVVLRSGQRVAVTGFSFGSQWVKRPVIEDYPQATGKAEWHIGMLHGSLESLHSPAAHYAPFTLKQLLEKNYDYWALGHIHKRQSLDERGTINYSGNIQGRHINEPGEKGYLLVKSDQQSLKTSFVATAPIVWEELRLPLGKETVGALANTLVNKLKAYHFNKMHFLRIILTNRSQAPINVLKAISDGTLLAAVQDLNSQIWEQLNCWVTSIKLAQERPTIVSQLDQAYFDQARDDLFTADELRALAGSLKRVAFINQDLTVDDSFDDIFNRATTLLQENIDDQGGEVE